MIGFVVEEMTGRALRLIQVSNSQSLLAQAQSGEVAIEGSIDSVVEYVDFSGSDPVVANRQSYMMVKDKTHILDDGVDAAILTLPDPCYISINGQITEVIGGSYQFSTPLPGLYIFKLVGKYNGQIEIVVMSITQAYSVKNQEILNAYNARLYGGFNADFDGIIHNFQSDETSMNLISGTAAVAGRVGLPAGFLWKTSDNQFLPFGVAEIQALEVAMFGHIHAIFTGKETKKAVLSALTDLQDIINFNAETGW